MAKTATLPPLRVTATTKRKINRLLREDETISSFVEESVRQNITRRETQKEFIERGLASAKEAKRTGKYFSANDVLKRLDAIIAKA